MMASIAVSLFIVIAVSSSASAAQNGVSLQIQTGNGVLSSFQCSPCHKSIDGFNNPKIMFKHSYHLLMDCDSCHTVFPHQQSGLVKPAMDVCYICHGINHGSQRSMANGKCGACHPAGFKKEPGNHSRAWKAKGHNKTTVDKSRGCMKCHTGESCEACHAKKNVPARPLKTYFFEYTIAPQANASLAIDISSQVEQNNCIPCHRDMDSFRNTGLIFKHEMHLKRGMKCAACHEKYPHLTGDKRPTMKSCYNCHGVKHGAQGLVAKENCAACHPKNFKLMPSNHTKAWKAKYHRSDVKKDADACAMCHKPALCIKCHAGKKVKPADHRKKEAWRRYHGKVTTELSRCEICHPRSLCANCHKTEIPHSVVWVAKHNSEGRKKGAKCKMCHYERGYCADCHHVRSLTRTLVLQTCVKCHPVLKKKPQLVRKSPQNAKGLLIHKYHFEMTKTPPFKCAVCHEGGIQKGKQCFNFNLCYECHGKYQGGRLIAKWGGKELCYRCHPEQRKAVQ